MRAGKPLFKCPLVYLDKERWGYPQDAPPKFFGRDHLIKHFEEMKLDDRESVINAGENDRHFHFSGNRSVNRELS